MIKTGLSAKLAAVLLALGASQASAQEGLAIPAPAIDEPASTSPMETAVLAGGCFWGIQGVFQHTKGVSNAVSGYAGGDEKMARYDMVSGGLTTHAESVRISYDPKTISYGKLLQIYFSVAHDPTELNRQGPDIGAHYRSTIFPQNEAQANVAKAYIEQLDKAKLYDEKIATTIEIGKPFYPAEAYHQDYMTLNPNQPYIVYNDLPKIENLKKLFPEDYRDDPALVSEAGGGSG